LGSAIEQVPSSAEFSKEEEHLFAVDGPALELTGIKS